MRFIAFDDAENSAWSIYTGKPNNIVKNISRDVKFALDWILNHDDEWYEVVIKKIDKNSERFAFYSSLLNREKK